MHSWSCIRPSGGSVQLRSCGIQTGKGVQAVWSSSCLRTKCRHRVPLNSLQILLLEDYASRCSALFAVEARSTPVGYEALGNRVAALGLEPSSGQRLPPNWCLQTTPRWVPWEARSPLIRSARLRWSLERAGSTTLPGRLHKLCAGRVLRNVPLKLRTRVLL